MRQVILLTCLIALLPSGILHAQDEGIRYENYIYDDDIRTVQLFLTGDNSRPSAKARHTLTPSPPAGQSSLVSSSSSESE